MNRVVVITGASSGIGRAAAHAFAGHGDRLVLAARAAQTLAEVRAECVSAGAEAIAEPTDITEAGAVEALARVAVDRFGRIDVWVHTAAVMAYGRFEEVPERVFEQVVRTDLLGAATVARVALRHFRPRRAGTLILGSSVLGQVTAPYMSGYVVSKWGQRGLARVLRQENRDLPGVHICLVSPGSVDTPAYQQAASYLGVGGRPPPPLITPERVARAVVACADRPRREVTVGPANLVMRLGFTALPGVYDALAGPLMRQVGLDHRPVGPHDGTVFRPEPDGEAVHGGWRRGRVRSAALGAVGTAVLGAGAALLGVAALRRRR